ncbi:hypothetical protein niasHS_002239 [Heterodera schachtii]|uniref:Uncharacterized protein n=1 Tax=Heterodera schachtii TaxID=97005 RepID=A0ABD2KMN1_HETSC
MFCFRFSHFLFFFSLFSFFFYIFGASPNKIQATPVDAKKMVESRIKCYVCNSGTKGQADCTEDDHDKLKTFIKQCNPLTFGTFAGEEAKACRKVRQTVEDETTIVRECAYTGEELDGKRRTGNKGVTVLIDQCINDQNATFPCNSALSPPTGASVSLLFALSSMIFATFLCL